MRKKKDFTLRQIGKQFMIVDTSETNVDMSCVYTLNATAAYLWQEIGQEEFTEDFLVKRLCDRYDIDEATASNDVQRLVEEWERIGLIVTPNS